MMFRRLVTFILVLAQLTACAPGQGLPGGVAGILSGSFPNLPYLPGPLAPLAGQAQQMAWQAIYAQVGRLLGDELPIRLDASTAFAKIATPQNFSPTPIQCTPDNMDMPLAPGDYTCQVRLYCLRDSAHRPGFGVPYEFGPLQGKQAEAIGALLARGTVANTPPTTLQTISWEIQASIPLSQMPPQHQQVVHQLIPEYEQGLQGDFLQQIEDTYNGFRWVAGLPPLDALLGRMGNAGRTILQIRHSREAIRQNALNYERLDQEVYDRSEGGPRTYTPAVPQLSPWSQIRPGVIAQITIQQGNLGLNTLNLRVLPNRAETGFVGVYGAASVAQNSYIATKNRVLYRLADFAPAAPITIGRIFLGGGAAAEAGGGAAVLGTGGTILLVIGIGVAVQTLVMMMNNNGNNGGGRGSNNGAWTNKKAREVAEELGYNEERGAPFDSRNQLTFRKGNKWITPDVDGHSGDQMWKVFNNYGQRIGTVTTNALRQL